MVAELNGDFEFYLKYNHDGTKDYYWSLFGLDSPAFSSEKDCRDHAMAWLMESHSTLLDRVRRLEARMNLTGSE